MERKELNRMSNNKKAHHEEAHHKSPKHGAVWGTWLVLILLHGLGAFALAYTTKLEPEFANNRSLILASLTVAAVLQVISAIGMWFWKKWGLYLYVVVTFIQMAAHMVLTASVWVGFYDAIPLLITGYLINYNQRIKNFK